MTQTSEDSPRYSKRWPAFFRMSATFEIMGPPVRQGFFQAEQLECAG